MNQLTVNNYFPLTDIETKMVMVEQQFERTHIQKIFKQPQKNCLKFLKSLWSDINIEDHCKLTNIDFNRNMNTDDIHIPETIDAQCSACLNSSKRKLSTFEQLFLSNYNSMMNDFEDTIIK